MKSTTLHARSSQKTERMRRRTADALQGTSPHMRCYFDVLMRVHLDTIGAEVTDLGGAVAEARQAIAESHSDGSGTEFAPGSFLLVRGEDERLICMIPLHDPESDPPINR